MFNERLAEALKKNNMTGNALCKKLNIENRSYTNWKNNKLPRGETLKEIANILNVSTDWLLERENALKPEHIKLLKDYDACDELGRETIVSVAELQAKRSKTEQTQQDNTTLKPFA